MSALLGRLPAPWGWVGAAGGVALLALLALGAGAAELGWSDIAAALGARLGVGPGAGAPRADVVVWELRVPRALCALGVGAALAISGALLQGLFRNPMASPGIIGVNAGAALGASSALALGLGAVSLWAVPLAAFAGALAAAAAVYALAAYAGRPGVAGLVLCGIAINAIASALTSLVLASSADDWELGRAIIFWLMGGLQNRTWEHVAMFTPFLVLGLCASLALGRALDLLATGQEPARALGLDVRRVEWAVLAAAAACAGAAVAVAGVLAFVGLVVPHMARLCVGARHARLLPASALGGAGLLVALDALARVFMPEREIQLGIWTSGLGGPFFLYLVARHGRAQSAAA